MNGDDVGFRQSRNDLRFTPEAPVVLRVARERWRQQLEGDVPVALRVIRLVNFPHSARAQQRIKAIVSYVPQAHESGPPPENSIRQVFCSAPQLCAVTVR